ncbi:MAG: maleylacetate reductase [Acidimicrobiaceae bacterium]
MRPWTHTGFAQQLVFGPGAVKRVSDLLKALGARRVLLVTTEGRNDSDDGARVRAALGSTLVSTFAEVTSHVPVPSVQRAVQQARRDAVDAVVSFGGGSCADMGKAVCFFTEQEAGTPGASYADRPALPHIAIPTTYSGAELTGFFGMTDPTARQKTGAGGPTITPMGAIYDPELTLSTPPRVSAETGMNALAHCVEVVYSPSRTPEAEAIGLAGAKRIVNALPLVVDDPGDVDVRASMLEGAALAGRCLQNGSMGVHHGLSQLVGGRTGIAHGLANAMILPHAIRYNAVAAYDELERLGEAIGTPDDPAGAVTALVQRLGLPSGLGECGVTLEDLDAVARLSQANHNVRNNIRPVSEDDARTILSAAY